MLWTHSPPPFLLSLSSLLPLTLLPPSSHSPPSFLSLSSLLPLTLLPPSSHSPPSLLSLSSLLPLTLLPPSSHSPPSFLSLSSPSFLSLSSLLPLTPLPLLPLTLLPPSPFPFSQGRIFRDITLPNCSPSERHAIYVAMVMILAQLHSVDWRAVGLESFGRQGDYSKRQVCGYMCRERERER